jgi:hypothetical protein
MGNKSNQQILIELSNGQSALMTEMKIMSQRLFGGDGQEGSLKFIYRKHEELQADVSEIKEKIHTEIKGFKESEHDPLCDKVSKLESASEVTTWKIGTATGVGGASLTVLAEWLIKKFTHGV